MNNIIAKILKTGMSKTRKYTVDDLVRYFYPLKHIIQQNDAVGAITLKENEFWSFENDKNRMEFLRDCQNLGSSMTEGSRFKMLNRFENGDKYGIDTSRMCEKEAV